MESDYMDLLYEEQFRRYLLVAKSFVGKLKRIQDRKICVHWIQRLSSLTPHSASVGRNRNFAFQYLLRVIQEAVLDDMLQESPDLVEDFKQIPIQSLRVTEDPAWLESELEVPEIQDKIAKSDAPYFAHWSHDQKTYIAAKALPGKGALVYLAVATDPSLGWSNLAE